MKTAVISNSNCIRQFFLFDSAKGGGGVECISFVCYFLNLPAVEHAKTTFIYLVPSTIDISREKFVFAIFNC